MTRIETLTDLLVHLQKFPTEIVFINERDNETTVFVLYGKHDFYPRCLNDSLEFANKHEIYWWRYDYPDDSLKLWINYGKAD